MDCSLLVFLLSFLCALSTLSTAQDIHLSQFNRTPLLRNPALAGLFVGDIRIQSVYRNQWRSVAYPYRTVSLGYDQKFKIGSGNDHITFGAASFYDEAGIMKLKTLQLMPLINYHKSLSDQRDSYLNAGFMAGFINRQFDGRNLSFDNQYVGGRYYDGNPTGENFIGISRTFFDMAAGISYNGQLSNNAVFYIGTAWWHFHQPSVNFLSEDIRLSSKIQANIGYKRLVSPTLEFTFEANYLKQGVYNETIGAVMIKYFVPKDMTISTRPIEETAIGAGIMYRNNDAIVPYLSLDYNNFDIGLSYDVNISTLKTASQYRGGFELSLTFRSFTKGQSSTLTNIRCPRF
jgi:type IX secretion system PorP/SprF family membrane protein